jgi:hypothetical protein
MFLVYIVIFSLSDLVLRGFSYTYVTSTVVYIKILIKATHKWILVSVTTLKDILYKHIFVTGHSQ